MGSKELKLLQDNESRQDRIRILPDSLIHRILSLLPSTKDAIRTSVLSKRWQKLWTYVPVLVFDFFGSSMPWSDMSRCIDNTLTRYNCSKLMKFHMKLPSWCNATDHEKLRFAIPKEVEELILNFHCIEMFVLPDFIFNSASLVKLHVDGCIFIPVGSVTWPNLKHLYVESGSFLNQSIEMVASGSPLLESLELKRCDGIKTLVMASEYLKRLVLQDLNGGEIVLTISCPNLVEFCAIKSRGNSLSCFRLCGAIGKDASSISFDHAGLKDLVIDLDSLKRLVLARFAADCISVTCPNLEELNLYSLHLKLGIMKLIRLPSSSISVDFDFSESQPPCAEHMQRHILWQVEHVKELKMGRCFIKSLSALEIARSPPSLWLALDHMCFPEVNKKFLIFDCGPNFVEYLPGIAYALRTSPELEKLVITLQLLECPTTQNRRNLYWNPSGAVFDCLVSHLKLVKVIGISEKDDKVSLVLNVVEYLLKNGRVLEKLVIVFQDRAAHDFVSQVSQKLLGCQTYAQHVAIELV